MTVEKCRDGSFHLRIMDPYVPYEVLGAAKEPRALPPSPRSLPHVQTLAQGRNNKVSAALTVEPYAAPLGLRSLGSHPWRNSYMAATGHFYLPLTGLIRNVDRARTERYPTLGVLRSWSDSLNGKDGLKALAVPHRWRTPD